MITSHDQVRKGAILVVAKREHARPASPLCHLARGTVPSTADSGAGIVQPAPGAHPVRGKGDAHPGSDER